MSYQTLRLRPDDAGISKAAEMLREGQLVAMPTETVYGLAADATNDLAVAGIFAAKKRPRFNPLIIHVPDLAGVEEIAEIPEAARPLLAFWPGPLTLVLPRRADSGLSDLVSAGLDTIAVRVPAHPLAQAFLRAVGVPVAAPSANPSGKISPTTADHVMDSLSGLIGGVLDGGACEVGLESTIVGFTPKPTLLRKGGIPRAALEAALLRPLADPVAGGDISAPGQLSSHYAPCCALRLDAAQPNGEAWLGFGNTFYDVPSLNLSPAGDLREAAANLFAYMRKLDRMAHESGLTKIAVAPIPDTGLGEAINDRLRRAAAPRP